VHAFVKATLRLGLRAPFVARNKHQHVLSSSCHPQHTKKAIPFILALRIHRTCSTDAKFTLRLNELNSDLVRGYHFPSFPLTAYFLLLHITHHFLTFLISYVNIFIYYFSPNTAGKFLSIHPSSRLLTKLVYHRDHYGLAHYSFFFTGATRQIKSHNLSHQKFNYMIQCNRCP